MINVSNRRLAAFWLGVVLAVSLFFPGGAALASHEDSDTQVLNVEPETATRVVGTVHQMTATIGSTETDEVAATQHPTEIDAEIESGPNDQDGATYGTPDLGCTIPVGATSCILSYTGQNTGTDVIRAWIDYDRSNATVEADQNEDRDERTDPAGTPDLPADDNRTARGTGCPDPGTPPDQEPDDEDPLGINQEPEPDCTDVVSVTWVSSQEPRPTTLDCDDSGPPDTEREANQSTSSPNATSDEEYRCTVRDQNGDQMENIEVSGEVENGINDPDAVDGDSKDRPDYNCVTEQAPVTEDPDGETFYCDVIVRQWEGEQGMADICFWVGGNDVETTGNALCANEQVGEDQNANPPFQGDGSGNDLADRVWKAWHQYELDCVPEEDTNPTNTSHEITCTVQSVSRDATTGEPTRGPSGINIDVEASGANDPQNDGDTSTSRRNPDFTCTTRSNAPTTTENEAGTCVIRHGTGGTGSTSQTGVTLYRAWIDIDNNNQTDEADAAEGRDENTQPGSELERDDTDVVEKRWTNPPTALTIEPESDTAPVGSCNPYTITAMSGSNSDTPAEGAIIDVEQRHARSQNGVPGDEPRVSFCTPSEGPNPSPVDESRGDLSPPQEEPDNPGTAGGETTRPTDSQGKVTIGIMVQPANGSDGTGLVNIIAFWETNDNDDPNEGEPQDTATKNWVASQARSIDCEPETATNTLGTQHVVTCTVRNASGQPVAGEGVTFTESGPGTISPTQANTDQNGQARTTATSNEAGTQTITGTITSDTQGTEPTEVDECDRPANDPQGAPAGECSDTVTKNWTASQARSIDCEPETATNTVGTQHVVTCTVRNASGQPAAGESVTFTESGPGTISPAQGSTDQNGQARTTATSTQNGTQTITGTITSDLQGGEPTEVDECDRGANDPQGAQAGACSDSVEKTWTGGVQTECSDGLDNDDDGQTDFPADDGCDSATDDSEEDFPEQEFGGETGQRVDEGACAGFTTGSVQANSAGTGLVIVGTNGDDALQGSNGNDLICALDGEDTVNGDPGDDTIWGGGGRDSIEAGDGDDDVRSEGGRDLANGGDGEDEMFGGRSHDNLSGGADADVLRGEAGWDTLKGNGGNDRLIGAGGRDVLQGGGGNDTAVGGGDDDVIRGYRGNDILRAGGGDDVVKGFAGRDRLFGNAGSDFLSGGPGRDRCRGGSGNDTLRRCNP